MDQIFFTQAVKAYGKSLVYSPTTCMNVLRMDPQLRSTEQINLLVRINIEKK